MNLHFWISKHGNFGDDLNTWLWDHALPGWRDWDPSVTLVGVGTILNGPHLNSDGRQRYLVVGSGQGNGPAPDFTQNEWDIRAVRGPRSARAIGAPPERAISDPAILVPDLPEFANVVKISRPVLVPHISSLPRHDWTSVCAHVGADYVSPEQDARAVIARIAGAPLVLAESMHAAILADAFRVPWIALAMSPVFDEVKWHDWADSLGLTLNVHALFPEIERLKTRLGRAAPVRTAHHVAPHAGPPPQTLPQGPTGTTPKRRAPLAHTPRDHVPLIPRSARLRYEELFLASRLRQILQKPQQLSATDRLEGAQDRLRDLCQQIRRDYGDRP